MAHEPDGTGQSDPKHYETTISMLLRNSYSQFPWAFARNREVPLTNPRATPA